MKILLPVDDSKGTQATLNWAVRFLDKTCARLYLLHVIFWSVDALVTDDEIETAQKILKETQAFLQHHGFEIVEAKYVLGSPPEAICTFADERGIDQIIIGSRGHRGLHKILMGNISQGVYERAKQPVLLLNNIGEASLKISHPQQINLLTATDRPRKVLLPVDGSEGSQRTLEWVTQFLNPKTSQIYLLNVYSCSPEGGYRYPTQAMSDFILRESQAFLEKHALQIQKSTSLLGAPSKVICDYAKTEGIDEIIMGSHGEQGLSKILMGSVTQRVLSCAELPVIVLNNSPKPFLTIKNPEQLDLSQGQC